MSTVKICPIIVLCLRKIRLFTEFYWLWIEESKYNDFGKEIEKVYFDENGKPTLNKDGYHKFTAKYDERGKIIEAATFGVTGEPILNKGDFKKRIWRYNDNDLLAEEISFGIDDKFGFSKLVLRYNEFKNVIYYGFFDDHDNPTFSTQAFGQKYANKFDNLFGYSEIYDEYNAKGKLVTRRYSEFKKQEWGYAQIVVDYDENGNSLKRTYLDGNGKQLETEIVVKSVLPDSQAKKLGIKSGDIFIFYNGKPVSEIFRFIAQRNTELPDSSTKELQVLRDGNMLKFMISPGEIGVNLQNRVNSGTSTP
ncbi:MAG: hypothetical protein GY749_38960 [Desulfobacteraceae bacterium]|nr:hypothetical protein [Desulfobacteraceae bacterium]